MDTAMTAAAAINQGGALSAPILARLAVNCTSGTTANGSCRLKMFLGWFGISYSHRIAPDAPPIHPPAIHRTRH